MKKKKVLPVLFVFILMNANIYAQDPYVDASQLPSASMQGDFDPFSNIANIDLFTGITSFNIPICNRSVDGLDVSVSLSYDAKGVPVDQTASSIGLGWDLSAGGYISREVKGMEDEYNYTIGISLPGTDGGPTEGLQTNLGLLVSNPGGGQYETEHDCFTAIFGGRTVKFAFDGVGGISTSPHCNIQVQMMVDGVAYTDNLPGYMDKTQNTHVLTFG